MNRLELNEQAIKSTDPETIKQVRNCYGTILGFRVYARTTSEKHIAAGADYRLQVSFDTEEQAQSYIDMENSEQVDFQFETYLIRS
jgi:hypothetical protein